MYPEGLAMEIVSSADFKTALFGLNIDTAKYFRDKWLAGKQWPPGMNEIAKDPR